MAAVDIVKGQELCLVPALPGLGPNEDSHSPGPDASLSGSGSGASKMVRCSWHPPVSV